MEAVARRVGVAVDFSACSKEALKWAVDNIVRDGDHLILVSVLHEGHYEEGEMQLWETTGSRTFLFFFSFFYYFVYAFKIYELLDFQIEVNFDSFCFVLFFVVCSDFVFDRWCLFIFLHLQMKFLPFLLNIE